MEGGQGKHAREHRKSPFGADMQKPSAHSWNVLLWSLHTDLLLHSHSSCKVVDLKKTDTPRCSPRSPPQPPPEKTIGKSTQINGNNPCQKSTWSLKLKQAQELLHTAKN